MVANPSKFQLIFLSKYKNIEKTCLLMEKSLNHQIQMNYLELSLPKTKIQWNLPIADIPNKGHAMNNGINV